MPYCFRHPDNPHRAEVIALDAGGFGYLIHTEGVASPYRHGETWPSEAEASAAAAAHERRWYVQHCLSLPAHEVRPA